MAKKYHGFLIINEFKKEGKHPDYFGIITIAGSEYKLAGWLDKTKEGRPKINLRVSLRKRPSVQDKIDAAEGGDAME